MSAPEATSDRAVSAFVQLWMDGITAASVSLGAASFGMRDTPPEKTPDMSDSDLQLVIVAAGNARGEMSMRLPSASAMDLAKFLVKSADPSRAQLDQEDRSALEEFFRQVAGGISGSAKPKGLEIQLTVQLGQAPTWSPGASGWICSAASAPFQIQMEWKLSSALAAALVSAWHEPEGTEAAQTPASPKTPPSKLGLLMDVELDVMLRFGGRNMLLKEILELGPGSVIELDRSIQDDADLLLDGKLIARGEVVVVEGNFGVRITQVLAGLVPA